MVLIFFCLVFELFKSGVGSRSELLNLLGDVKARVQAREKRSLQKGDGNLTEKHRELMHFMRKIGEHIG